MENRKYTNTGKTVHAVNTEIIVQTRSTSSTRDTTYTVYICEDYLTMISLCKVIKLHVPSQGNTGKSKKT